MKKLFLFLSLVIITVSSYAQNSPFEFTFGYGLYYSDFTVNNTIQQIDYSTPFFGKSLELSFDYEVARDKYVGLGYTSTSNTRVANGQVLLEEGIGLSFDNFRVEREVQFYDIHFRKQFQNGLNLSVGAFYFLDFMPNLGFNNFGTTDSLFFEISDEEFRTDDFGVFLALDYLFEVSNSFQAGLRGKLFYTLDGIEGFSFAPVLRFHL